MRTKRLPSIEIPYRVVTHRSIRQIEPILWDSINAPNGLYCTHRFLSCVESSSAAGTEFWYFLLFKADELVATAVLSAFEVSLDLLLPNWVQRLCRIVRRVYSSFLRLHILFCGIPVSIGKNTLVVSDKVPADPVLEKLNHTMIEIAGDRGIRYLCFKEFTERDLPLVQSLEDHGYFRAHSIPRFDLRLHWPSFGKYLQSMRHGYRRAVQRSLRQIRLDPGDLTDGSRLQRDDRTPRLTVQGFTPELAARTHELYLEVMRHAETKLEILDRRFFEALADQMSADLVSICLADAGGLQGTALLGRNGAYLNFMFVGFNYEFRDRYQTYFNLLNGIISYGIEEGFETIDLGQTTCEIKQRLGGEAESVYFYLRALSPWIHKVLQGLNQVLFPRTVLHERHVFRS